MKISNINDPENFFKALDKCKGQIHLKTSEGDRVNLKSKLCQYIALTSLFSEARIDHMEIELSNQEDMTQIIEFLVKA